MKNLRKLECIWCCQVIYKTFADGGEVFDFHLDTDRKGKEFCLEAPARRFDSRHCYLVSLDNEEVAMEEVLDAEHDRVMENMDLGYV